MGQQAEYQRLIMNLERLCSFYEWGLSASVEGVQTLEEVKNQIHELYEHIKMLEELNRERRGG